MSDRTELLKLHDWDELLFGGFYCLHCTPDDEDSFDAPIAWPCQPLREAGVTDDEAREMIAAYREKVAAEYEAEKEAERANAQRHVGQFNASYPVGTPVFAYPGARPEDIPSAPRLVTRTRTEAQLSSSGYPVVWVEGEGSYICLTHVDPVAEDVWEEARAEETAAAVAALGALPVPVGDQPQPLDDIRLAEALAAYEGHPDLGFACCSAHAVADHVPALQAEVQRLKAERDGFRDQRNAVFATNEQLLSKVEESGQARLRADNETRTAKREADALRTRVAELEAELESAVAVSEALNRTLHDEKLAGSALYAALTRPTTPEQRQAALDRFLAVAQRTGQLHGPSEKPAGMHHAIRTINPAEEA